MEYIIIAIIAYLIGSINFSILISKKKAGYDIRQKGSGNAGTTNMLRNLGKKYAAITLICDVLKGLVAIVIAIIVGNILKDTNILIRDITRDTIEKIIKYISSMFNLHITYYS